MTSPPASMSPAGPGAPDGAGTSDGAVVAGLPAVWLRDDCPCPLCQDPVSGQRLLHITGIPADISVAAVTASAGTVQVLFRPDGHRAVAVGERATTDDTRRKDRT